jgi:predicted DNA-binding transcriptional regulator AlpA
MSELLQQIATNATSPAALATTQTTGEELLDSLAAARFLNISPRKLWSLTSPRDQLRCIRIGRSVRFSKSDLLAFIESARR